MVDASMRDESLRRLLSLHRVFYDLSPLAFCKAVSLVDTFITHVKVKPKYMMCVAVACYYIVSKFEPREVIFYSHLFFLHFCALLYIGISIVAHSTNG